MKSLEMGLDPSPPPLHVPLMEQHMPKEAYTCEKRLLKEAYIYE